VRPWHDYGCSTPTVFLASAEPHFAACGQGALTCALLRRIRGKKPPGRLFAPNIHWRPKRGPYASVRPPGGLGAGHKL